MADIHLAKILPNLFSGIVFAAGVSLVFAGSVEASGTGGCCGGETPAASGGSAAPPPTTHPPKAKPKKDWGAIQRQADDKRKGSAARAKDLIGGGQGGDIAPSSPRRTQDPGALSGQINRLGDLIRKRREEEKRKAGGTIGAPPAAVTTLPPPVPPSGMTTGAPPTAVTTLPPPVPPSGATTGAPPTAVTTLPPPVPPSGMTTGAPPTAVTTLPPPVPPSGATTGAPPTAVTTLPPPVPPGGDATGAPPRKTTETKTETVIRLGPDGKATENTKEITTTRVTLPKGGGERVIEKTTHTSNQGTTTKIQITEPNGKTKTSWSFPGEDFMDPEYGQQIAAGWGEAADEFEGREKDFGDLRNAAAVSVFVIASVPASAAAGVGGAVLESSAGIATYSAASGALYGADVYAANAENPNVEKLGGGGMYSSSNRENLIDPEAAKQGGKAAAVTAILTPVSIIGGGKVGEKLIGKRIADKGGKMIQAAVGRAREAAGPGLVGGIKALGNEFGNLMVGGTLAEGGKAMGRSVGKGVVAGASYLGRRAAFPKKQR